MSLRLAKFAPLVVILAAAALIFPSCRAKSQSWQASRTFYALSTACSIRADVSGELDGIERLVRGEEAKLSAFDENSFIYRINALAGREPVEVSQDVFDLIKRVRDLSYFTEGRFNPMIGAATSLYRDETGAFSTVPDDLQVTRVIEDHLLDISDLELDEERCQVFLKREGEALDLGGVAKGWILERVAKELEAMGCKRFILNFGGDILAHGDTDFQIGIQDPKDVRGRWREAVCVRDESVVTSGAYERNFTSPDGVFYHHIIDPKTAKPCRIINDSVTVISSDPVLSDVLSTALFIDPQFEQKAMAEHPDIRVVFL